jgi:hypothetical protein
MIEGKIIEKLKHNQDVLQEIFSSGKILENSKNNKDTLQEILNNIITL